MKKLMILLLCFFLPLAALAAGDYPVYVLQKRSRLPAFDPALINASGIQSSGADSITFNDGAVLTFGEDAGLQYSRYAGTVAAQLITGGSEQRPYDTLAGGIMKLGAAVYGGTLQDPLAGADFCEELGGVTFTQAQAQAEALLKALGINDPVCAYALDMTLPRIRALDGVYSGFRAVRYPYAQAAAADEGYYMVYRARVDGAMAAEDFFFAFVFVDSRGIAGLSLRSEYTLGPRAGSAQPTAAESACVADICQRYGVTPEAVQSTGVRLYAERQPNGQTRLLPYYTFRYEAALFSGETAPMHAAYSIQDGRLLFSGTGVRPVE